jgi:hypothetical protein
VISMLSTLAVTPRICVSKGSRRSFSSIAGLPSFRRIGRLGGLRGERLRNGA